ncbi:MAG: STAS domain-containing protein [Halioglobus sp.]|nr:STAS domain-containing protein [Halioglobus sp.]
MYANRNILVLTVPADITSTDIAHLYDEISSVAATGGLQGVVVDCSKILAADTIQARRVFRVAKLARIYRLSAVFCCIREGVATALVELDFKPGDVQTATTVDQAMQQLERPDVNLAAS